jgi:Fe(3+) dicitrate transport protein
VIAQPETLGDDAEFAEEPDVIVSGSRPERAAGSAHVLTRRQLERFRRDDPNAIVSQIPGVYVRQEDGVGLRPNIGIRGVNADRSKKITLMEDGVLFGPAPYSAPAAYYFPLMTRMVQVRAVKGPCRTISVQLLIHQEG